MFTKEKCMQTIILSFLFVLLVFSYSAAQDSTAMNIIDGFQGIAELKDVEFLDPYLIAVAGTSGLLLIENYLTDSPEIVLQVQESCNSKQQVIVDGNIVYTLGDCLDRFDFSDPLNPIFLDSNYWDRATDESQSFIIYEDKLIYSVYDDIYMVIWGENGLINIQSLLHLSLPFIHINNFKIFDQYIYVLVHNYEEQSDELMVWNIENPENPQPVVVPDITDESAILFMDISDNYVVLTSDSEIILLDNRDPEYLAILDSWTYTLADNPYLTAPRIIDNYIMCNNFTDNGGSILTLEIDNNDQIMFISETPFEGINYYVNSYNQNYAIWLRYDIGLTILDTSSPFAPVLNNVWNPSSSFDTPVIVDNNILTSTYMTNDSLQIFDFSNTNHVTHTGEYLPEDVWGTSIAGSGNGYLVLRVYEDGNPSFSGWNTMSTHLAQVDPDNPGNLIMRGVLEEELGLFDAVIYGNALYGASIADSTVNMYNISNPDSPFLVDVIRFPAYNNNYKIIIDNDKLYIGYYETFGDNRYHIRMYDLVDPFVPALLTDMPLSIANSFVVQDNLIIVEFALDLEIFAVADNDSICPLATFEQYPFYGNSFCSEVNDIQDGFLLMTSAYGLNMDIGYIQIIDINNPVNPEVVGTYTVPGIPSAIFAGDKIFASWESGYALFSWNGTAVEETNVSLLPANPELSVYPNPANPSTNISLILPSDGSVNLKVFDLLGREVDELYSGNLNAGTHQFTFLNTQNLSSGTYFVKGETDSWMQTEKFILIK